MLKPLIFGFVFLFCFSLISAGNPQSKNLSRSKQTRDTVSVFPYVQSFENNQQWIVGGQNPSWQLGTPNNSFINSASQGQVAWVTGLSTPYNSYEKSWVESPVFDFSNLVAPRIKFDIIYECEDYEDGVCFEYSIDNGLTWSHVGQYGDPDNWYNAYFIGNLFLTNSLHGWTSDPFSGWHEAKHDLTFLAGQSHIKFRFYMGASQNLNSFEGFGFDNLIISDLVPFDMGVSAILFPVDNCILSNSEEVVIELTNNGTMSASGFTISYNINGSSSVTEFFSGAIGPGQSIPYTFISTVDLSGNDTITFIISVNLSGDMAAYNDTVIYTLILEEPISLPWFENFQSGTLPAGWTLKQEPTSDGWIVGTNLGSTYFDIPPHTFYITSNDDTCYCDMSNDMLITPAFDFSIYSEVTLQFESYINGFYGSSGKILASVDCGYTWEHVQFITADTFNWQTQIVDLSNFAGESSVKIAFHHNDNGLWAAGFAVDDISLTGVLYSETQTIGLIQDWGLMSTYLAPLEPSIDSLFANINSLLIVKNGSGSIYWPSYQLNLIGNAVIGKGYQYRMSSPDTMYVIGIPVFPELEPISIPIGWSILGYLRNSPALADVMLNAISTDIEIMKNENGTVYWPLYNLNMIGNMLPGKGYQINMINQVTFTYPPN